MLPAISAIASTSASGIMNGLQTQMQTLQSAQLPGLSSMPNGVGFKGTEFDGTGLEGTNAMPFADLLTDAVGEVNRLQDQAGRTVRGLMTGTGVDVHQAMIATEKASMAFELALAVRNKAVQAYQQVMSMQF
jgi:flagellar hook-basal body complex protein FliE